MNIELDKQEVLRYLGYRGQTIDAQTHALIDSCMDAMLKTAKPRYVYRVFSVQADMEKEQIILPDCGLVLPGRDIYEHLRECRSCAMMAATLGIEADNLIRVSEAGEMSRAVVLDACATEMIEKVSDWAEREIELLATREKKGITSRFSPGYGDLPLTLQGRFGEILDTVRKIGLTITENALMIPRKSVTALIGFTVRPKRQTSKCAVCSMGGQCKFRKEGNTCGR